MATMSEVTTGINNALKTQYILQSGADSTVAGGTHTINSNGEYIFEVEGTLDTAKPALYCKRVGLAAFDLVTAKDGTTAELSVDGTGITVLLSRGDEVYSQTTVVGGSSDYTTVLNLTK